MNKNIASLYKR